MAMTLIVDASVAAKWFFDESGSSAARELIGREPLVAPDLILLEVHHAMWKRWRRGETSFEAVKGIIAILTSALERVEPSMPLIEAASRLSLALEHPIYDCLYVVLAQDRQLPLITADERLFAIASKAKVAAQLL
jgi:predicted nucleic acid-binding protein